METEDDMTKSDAEEYLARNPKVRKILDGMDMSKFDHLFLPNFVSTDADAQIDWVQVAKAAPQC
jgi:hypothetical protein